MLETETKPPIETEESLEELADEILAKLDDGPRTYSERALSRKIRRENARLPEVEETEVPCVVVDYLLQKQIQLLIDSCKISRTQASILALSIHGWKVIDISLEFKIPYPTVLQLIERTRRKLAQTRSPYDGLYEVYWGEVNRYIYRRPQSQMG